MVTARSFVNTEECLEVAFDALVDQALEVTSDAYDSAPGEWAEAIHAALAALLGFLAGSPALTQLCELETAEDDGSSVECRDRALARFARFLLAGHTKSATPLPDVVSEAIAGGIYELVRAHAIEGQVKRLPDSLPQATMIALSPFLGSERAEQLASSGMPTNS